MPRLTEPVVPAGAMNRMPQPTLDGDGLVLRPWETGDAPVVVAAYEDPDIRRWHARTMDDVAEAAVWVADQNARWVGERGANWAVVRGGEVVGRVGLNGIDLDEGSGELAYWVVPSARGAGIASRAAVQLTEWALGTLGLHRVALEHSTENLASCSVADRAGFTAEGVRRSAVLHADGWHDMHLHARIAG